MNVLEICMSSGHGGLEMYMAKVADYLAHGEHNVSVIIKKHSFLDQRLGEQSIERSYLTVTSHHFPLLAAFKLAKFIRRHDIDLIHVHHGKDLFLCVLAKVIANRGKLVYTRQMNLTRFKNDIYHRFLYKNVDAYLCITQLLHDDAVKYLPIEKNRVQVLYYGVPVPPEETIDCRAFTELQGLNPDAIKVAIFGRVEEIKGQHLVVQAVKMLISEGLDIQAAMIGHIMDKKYFAQIEKVIKENQLETDIKYLGFHDTPVSIMPCFDIVVLATRCETFGLVLPEAMRAGTCVVGTNCGGVPEIIQHNKTGLLFMPGDVQDLANQLRRLANNADYRNEVANAGKIDADLRFSEEKHFARLMTIFGELTQ